MGDIDPLGLTITLLYFVATFRCWRRAGRPATTDAPTRLFFRAAAVMLAVLGINKQADLQILVSTFGRQFLQTIDLYEQRWFFQVLLVVVLAVVTTAGLLVLFRLAGSQPGPWVTLLGMTAVLGYALMRAISFDIRDLRVFHDGVNVTWILELVGLLVVTFGCDKRLVRSSEPKPASSST